MKYCFGFFLLQETAHWRGVVWYSEQNHHKMESGKDDTHYHYWQSRGYRITVWTASEGILQSYSTWHLQTLWTLSCKMYSASSRFVRWRMDGCISWEDEQDTGTYEPRILLRQITGFCNDFRLELVVKCVLPSFDFETRWSCAFKMICKSFFIHRKLSTLLSREEELEDNMVRES